MKCKCRDCKHAFDAPPIHRLMCGDATSRADVEKLTGGQKVALTLTDLPYGVGWQYLSTDDTKENLERLIAGFLPIAREISEVVLITSGNSNQRLYPDPDWTLCWFCPAGVGRSPFGFCCWQPVLVYGRDPYLARGLGSRPVRVRERRRGSGPCP